MTPIPSSALLGHQALHQRTLAALQRCQEEQGVDFKESAPWEKLRWRITHTALGMGNLRDGGIVVVGVSERDAEWTLTGIDDAHLRTFEPDTVIDQVNSYVSPHVDLDVVRVVFDTKTFLSIFCREFRDTPLVCKKDGPRKSGIQKGRVYVRPPGLARTTMISRAEEMQDLLELAAEKRARAFMEMAYRVGFPRPPSSTPAGRFDRELGNL